MILINDHFKVLQRGKIIKICLNRPERGNSLSVSMIKDLTSILKRLSIDQSVNQIILTGEGKYFCTGMDLQEETDISPSEHYLLAQDLFRTIERCPKITIAVVNGPAFGGGVGLAFTCDIRVATTKSYFCLSEVKLGVCAAIIAKYLVREWGVGLARMAMVTAKRIEPRLLYNIGSIYAVAANERELECVTESILSKFKYIAPQAAAWSKILVREAGTSTNNVDVESRQIFEAMNVEGSEGCFGILKFREGNRDINWEDKPSEVI